MTRNQINPNSNNRTGIGVEVSGVWGSRFIAISSQINPTQKANDENTMCVFSLLLVCWIVESGVPRPEEATGAPHLGHADAAVETCVPHSGHLTKAIFPPCYLIQY